MTSHGEVDERYAVGGGGVLALCTGRMENTVHIVLQRTKRIILFARPLFEYVYVGPIRLLDRHQMFFRIY